MTQDAGSSLWPRSSRSWKDPWRDTEVAAGVSAMAAAEHSEDSAVEAGTSGDRDSEEEVETSEDSGLAVVTKVTDPRTKGRSGVLVKRLVSEWRREGLFTPDSSAHLTPLSAPPPSS